MDDGKSEATTSVTMTTSSVQKKTTSLFFEETGISSKHSSDGEQEQEQEQEEYRSEESESGEEDEYTLSSGTYEVFLVKQTDLSANHPVRKSSLLIDFLFIFWLIRQGTPLPEIR